MNIVYKIGDNNLSRDEINRIFTVNITDSKNDTIYPGLAAITTVDTALIFISNDPIDINDYILSQTAFIDLTDLELYQVTTADILLDSMIKPEGDNSGEEEA